jgi:hypothetical protein
MIFLFIDPFKTGIKKTGSKISLSKRKYLLLQLYLKSELTKRI